MSVRSLQRTFKSILIYMVLCKCMTSTKLCFWLWSLCFWQSSTCDIIATLIYPVFSMWFNQWVNTTKHSINYNMIWIYSAVWYWQPAHGNCVHPVDFLCLASLCMSANQTAVLSVSGDEPPSNLKWMIVHLFKHSQPTWKALLTIWFPALGDRLSSMLLCGRWSGVH